MTNSKFSYDACTGALYENNEEVGKLITVNSGTCWRLIDQANSVIEMQAALVEIAAYDMGQHDFKTAYKLRRDKAISVLGKLNLQHAARNNTPQPEKARAV